MTSEDLFRVIEAGQPGPRVEVIGEFDSEDLAVSYAVGKQQVNREAQHLWFVRKGEQAPSWVIDGDGLRRRPTTEEVEEYFG
ncbi:MAG: hypothetical protein M3N51_07680 [Actinomycetota bacterium]|nr:hypothetical protein [Actinomycetota bacterium]